MEKAVVIYNPKDSIVPPRLYVNIANLNYTPVILNDFDISELQYFFKNYQLVAVFIPLDKYTAYQVSNFTSEIRQFMPEVKVIGFTNEKVGPDVHELLDDVIEPDSNLNKLQFSIYKSQRQTESSPVVPSVSIFSYIRRIFDVIMASILLILTSPLFILISTILTFTSREPALKSHPYIGKDYRPILLYSFCDRTPISKKPNVIKASTVELIGDHGFVNEGIWNMHQSGELVVKTDDRGEAARKWLIKCRLNDLPRLFNVIQGELSFFGRRPVAEEEAEKLTTDHEIHRFFYTPGFIDASGVGSFAG